jgi:hypothetical protein
MLYDVTAIGLDPLTGDVVGGPRTERIDSDTNAVFRGCTGPWEIEDQYEAFWNRLDESWERKFPPGKEKVKVVRVEEVILAALN